MAKSRRRTSMQPAAPIMPPAPLGYNPAGQMEARDIVGIKEGWSEYTLSDKSVIRVKAVVLDVKKAVGQFNSDGNPVYAMQFAVINELTAPENLKKKG